MGREYPTDVLWRAQELYCVDRLSYAAVAEATGVSATTLKSWGQKYSWARRREEIAQAESEIRVNIIKGRQKALEQLLATTDAKEAASMAFARSRCSCRSSRSSLVMPAFPLSFDSKSCNAQF